MCCSGALFTHRHYPLRPPALLGSGAVTLRCLPSGLGVGSAGGLWPEGSVGKRPFGGSNQARGVLISTVTVSPGHAASRSLGTWTGRATT